MEITNNNLTPKQKVFLDSLSDYLEIKLLYYGSILREDYIPGKSDLDIDIFTDNEDSTLAKMQHFLHISKKDFRKVVWKLRKDDRVATGYKLAYTNDIINAEFAIYNEKFKKYITEDHNNKIDLPFYVSFMLSFLKILHYRLQVLPTYYYKESKRNIFSFGLGQKSKDAYVVL